MKKGAFRFVKNFGETELSRDDPFNVYTPEPDRCGEQNFIDRFIDWREGPLTTLIEIEDVGRRKISTRALCHMAIYLANKDNENFVYRQCHDFAATFLLGDAMENTYIHRPARINAMIPIATQCECITCRPPRLNDVILIPIEDDQNEAIHSQVVASHYCEGIEQLYISKFGNGAVVLHDWQTVNAMYGLASRYMYRRVTDVYLPSYYATAKDDLYP
jgi:hypothetical protein